MKSIGPKQGESFDEYLKRKAREKFERPAVVEPVTGRCGVCQLPMKVSKGQLVYFHKQCRAFRHKTDMEKDSIARYAHKKASIITR